MVPAPPGSDPSSAINPQEERCMSNIQTIDNFIYKDFLPKYESPRSDFLMRDARTLLGWDGMDPASVTGSGTWTYRNGDFKEHAVASEAVDTFTAACGYLDGPRSSW